MKRLLVFSAFFPALLAQAQAVRSPVSLYPSLTAYSPQFTDAFAFWSNTASLAGLKGFSAGLFSERRFALKELSSYSLAAALPTASGNVGFRADYFGAAAYNETTLGLAYGRKAGSKLSVGAQFLYQSLAAAGYGSASTVTFDAGLLFRLTDAVQTGLSVYNPVRMQLGKSGGERLPAVYSAGLGYDVSPQLFVGAELQKVEDQPPSVNAGLHYQFAEGLLARAGFGSATSVYYLGFGVRLKSLRVDLTAAFHPYLGPTPGLLLLYSSPEK